MRKSKDVAMKGVAAPLGTIIAPALESNMDKPSAEIRRALRQAQVHRYLVAPMVGSTAPVQLIRFASWQPDAR